ncbi:hypothetical protein DFR50_103115 [Roseiarcus fermentans]|uniref:Uncharacterized protein n=1 Tax=Roseiarcus fermentans TaxID=1473586 RepID=A0A366FT66_9HYPH|nr:hypothetical protein [Roseiarcus fermentans]RBP17230.1 hypothetical protein DFR50_103115 [Roseiarcus fermentans]
MTVRSTGTGPAGPTEAPARGLKEKAAEEFRRFLVLFVYLWVLFGVFALNQGIVMREQGIGWTWQGLAFVNALVFAKVMMLFEMVDPGRWLRRRPLIYPILYEAFLLTLMFLVVHVIETVIAGLVHGKTIGESLPSIGGGGLAGLLSVSVIVFLALTPFFAVRNLSFALGADTLVALLFKEPQDEGRR